METETEIQRFYRNKNVFLTGGTGFLGKAFIEKLLRATEVNCIYVMVRPKRGENINERIDNIFKDPLFETLHKLKAHPSKRVTPICGDCVLPHLGLSSEDRAMLIENVDVVVHSAATVRFNEPLTNALAINVRATMDLLQLAKKMLKLKAFVHVSSAFANCIESHVEERFYADKIGITASQICQMVDILGPDKMNSKTKELITDFPNTYCFTKALAEEAVLAHGSELPICMFRPGIVIPTCDEPVHGWIDNLYGPTSILYGVAYGVIRVMYMRIENTATLVPVDFCANAMLTLAWNTAKTVNQIKSLPPPIYNLVPDEHNKIRWKEYKRVTETHGLEMPIRGMIWYPFFVHTGSKLFFKILWFYYHIIPGYIFDFMLMLFGKKRRFIKTYHKVYKQTKLFAYFAENEWTFTTDNTKQLWKSLSAEDQRLFNFDMMSIEWSQYLYNSLSGMRRFLAKEEPSTIPKARQLLSRLLILHRTVQLSVYGGGAALLLWTYFRITQFV